MKDKINFPSSLVAALREYCNL